MYYVYILQDKNRNTTYIGYTSDLKRRLSEHKTKFPNEKLIYYEACGHKKDAQNRELQLKKRGQAVRHLKSRLQNTLN